MTKYNKKTLKSGQQLNNLISKLKIKEQNGNLTKLLTFDFCTIYQDNEKQNITYYVYKNFFGTIEKIDIFTDQL